MRTIKKGGTSYIVWSFNIMWYLIGFISAIDVYYAIKWREVLPQMEENPFGRMLIKYDADDISLFMGLKVAGTVLVLGFLQNWFLLSKREGRIRANRVTIGVFLFQIWLFLYMHDYFVPRSLDANL